MNPIVFEHSRIPVWLSAVLPMHVEGFSFAFFVFTRGPVTPRLLRHETVHCRQQVEMLFVFQWVAYVLFFLFNLARVRSWVEAYRRIPFEREARAYELRPSGLAGRRPYGWIGHMREERVAQW